MAVWSYESRSTSVRRPPQSDGLCLATIRGLGLVDFCGVLLETTSKGATQLSDAFRPGSIAYLRMLAGHRRRVSKETKRLSNAAKLEKVQKAAQKRIVSAITKPLGSLPFGIKFKDLKVVSCGECKKMLLAESLEYLRADAVEFKLRTVRNFPPPVCARLFGSRPYCSDCVKRFLARGQISRRDLPTGLRD